MTDLITSITTGFGTVAGDMLNAIGSIVPAVLPVLGAVMVVGVGIKIAKKVAGR